MYSALVVTVYVAKLDNFIDSVIYHAVLTTYHDNYNSTVKVSFGRNLLLNKIIINSVLNYNTKLMMLLLQC